jgi:catechol 2,3-dioxygenase-like lactoylglutathione lyase family enzyme
MENLPTPILGEITAFTVTTPDLGQSLAFYQKLGFKELFRADWPFPWIQITDGVLLMMLRKDPDPYIALTYYVKDINSVVADLDRKGISFTYRAKDSDPVKRFVFKSPDGLTISLVNIIEVFSQPPGPGMLTMPQQDYFNPEKYVNKVCGLFGEFAHPVADPGKSIAFWELLGFKAISKFTAPYPWAIISDGLSIVGLHQTESFNYPVITYFAADMKDKIEKLKAAGIIDYQEKGAASIVLTTPEQQHINLFKLGM